MYLKGKNITVIGAGRSGIGAAKLIKKIGGIPFVSDAGNENELSGSINNLKESGINYETGTHSDRVYDCETMVVSPGVPANAAVLNKARERNIKLISEVELAYEFCKGKIIAITGTNGKTTTTSLCGHVFNNCGFKTHVAGNIGCAGHPGGRCIRFPQVDPAAPGNGGGILFSAVRST